MELSREQFEAGRRNFQLSMGLNRRDFLRASIAAPALGAAYFGYREINKPIRAGIVGTGNEGCQAMIEQSPPGYVQYVAFHDIRPSQIQRARKQFLKLYGVNDGRKVRFHEKWEDMLADKDIEAIVVATPLWTHAKFAIEAMKAGKHVLCEKLMAHNITDAKAMVRASEKYNRILSIGHQRHYSTLYADALQSVKSGTLGQVKHIRALWHRNNAQLDPVTKEYNDGWKPAIPPEDLAVDVKKYGYKSAEELVRWRLFNRTGGGLMAELGSHQLDACSIFLEHKHPLAMHAVGGKYFYTDDRECEDHVYCTYEFPGEKFDPKKDARDNDLIVVTYSSINTNALQGYGEVVMGTRGTMMVMQERDVLLFNENDPLKGKREADLQKAEKERLAQASSGKRIEVKVGTAAKGESTMYSAASLGLPAEAAKSSGAATVSRGYREELEHFGFCIRHRDPANKVRCDGRVALADAVMALATNVAMRKGERLTFKDAWYDPGLPDVPDSPPDDLTVSQSV